MTNELTPSQLITTSTSAWNRRSKWFFWIKGTYLQHVLAGIRRESLQIVCIVFYMRLFSWKDRRRMTVRENLFYACSCNNLAAPVLWSWNNFTFLMTMIIILKTIYWEYGLKFIQAIWNDISVDLLDFCICPETRWLPTISKSGKFYAVFQTLSIRPETCMDIRNWRSCNGKTLLQCLAALDLVKNQAPDGNEFPQFHLKILFTSSAFALILIPEAAWWYLNNPGKPEGDVCVHK